MKAEHAVAVKTVLKDYPNFCELKTLSNTERPYPARQLY